MQTEPQNKGDKDSRSLAAELETIADDIRVRIHLAGMDLKDEWNKVEPHLLDVRAKIAGAVEVPKRTLDDLAARLKKLRAAL